MKFFFKHFSKKAQAGTDSALIQLFYIVLGVFVLLTFVKLLFTFISLDSSSNSDIVKHNAESISNFQSFSTSDSFKDLNDCYSLLKISNLETYQNSKKKENNYIIIISENGIYHQKRPSDYDKFYSELDLDSKTPDFKFDKPTKLFNDITNQGGIFGIDTTVDIFVTTLGESDPSITLEENVKYIILDSTIYENSDFEVVTQANKYFDSLENENKYKITLFLEDKKIIKEYQILEDNELITLYSKYLVFDQFKNGIFVSSGVSTDLILNSKLCSYTNFQNAIKLDEYKKDHGVNIPETKYDVFFKLYVNDELIEYNFAWKSQPLCYKKETKIDCTDIFYTYNDDGYDYYQYYYFISTIEKFGQDLVINYPNEFNLDLKHTYSPLSPEELMERKKTIDIKVLTDDVFGLSEEFKNVEEIENENYDDIIDIDNWEATNVKLNFCENDFCDTIFTKNGNAYFYIKTEPVTKNNIFVNFKEEFMVKRRITDEYEEKYKNYEFIFNGKIISKDKIKTYTHKSKKYYIFYDLEIDDKGSYNTYDIVLTSTQFRKMGKI